MTTEVTMLPIAGDVKFTNGEGIKVGYVISAFTDNEGNEGQILLQVSQQKALVVTGTIKITFFRERILEMVVRSGNECITFWPTI